MKGALWKIPSAKDANDILPLEKLADIDTTPYGSDLRTIAYHPVDGEKAVSVVDNNFVLWDLSFKPQVCYYLFFMTKIHEIPSSSVHKKFSIF